MSKLYVVGIGPGSVDYLTFKSKKIVDSIDILIGSKRALDLFPGSEAEKIQLDAVNMKSQLKLAVSRVIRGKSVALLSTGDPGFSGILKPILELSNDVEIEVVPGISSLQLCAAKLQIPWDNTNLITLHGKGLSNGLLKVINNGKPTIILPNFKVDELIRFLISNGVNGNRKAAVCEKLGYPDERVVESSLNSFLGDKFSYMCVIVIY
ncbi:MAG: precorrin-6y C5,15-methyltransferase (decarboxylating) subunit CbiE [Methanobacterium sp.]|jgi:cobalt-precorrin-7 (C5)-methyltransferase